MDYEQFLAEKKFNDAPSGHELTLEQINPALFDFQKVLVRWAVGRGRSAIFADTGLGKTAMQTEWAHQVSIHTSMPVLILAPLSVAHQTVRECAKFEINAKLHRAALAMAAKA